MDRRTSGTWITTSGAIALVALVLAGCSRFGGDDQVERVVVLGDSVVEQSSEAIEAALDAGGNPARAVGHPGYTTTQLLPHADDLFGEADRPDVAVVMTGHNDLWRQEIVDADLDAIVARMSEIRCSVLVLVPTKGPWSAAMANDLNDRLAERAEVSGVNVETAWRDAVDSTDTDAPSPTFIQPDTVHPTLEGRRELARIMAAAVAQSCSD